jgi:AraC-like DNA-binding protein
VAKPGILVGAMLAFRRRNCLVEGLAERHFSLLVAPGLRVYVAGSRGVVVDTAVVDSMLSRNPNAHVTIPLSGEFVLRQGRETSVGVGSVVVEQSISHDERWEGRVFSALVVEWKPERAMAAREIAPIGAADRGALVGFAERLAHGGLRGPEAQQDCADLLSRLAALGVPVSCSGLLEEPAESGGAQRFLDALGEHESNLRGQPMWVDLERSLGRSERHLRRGFPQSLALLGRNESISYRRQMRSLRMRLAASFVASEGTTVERVAASLGYGSARALLLAMKQAGLPTPAEIRARFGVCR